MLCIKPRNEFLSQIQAYYDLRLLSCPNLLKFVPELTDQRLTDALLRAGEGISAMTNGTAGNDIQDDTQDEIDKIMSEIETLQKELGAVESTTDSIVAGKAEPTVTEPEVLSASAEIQEQAQAEPTPQASDEMAEFRGGGGDAGLEETLGTLEEEPSKNPSILDEVISEQVVEEVAQEEDHKGASMPVQDIENSPESGKEENGSLSMTLTGNMTLKLKYAYEGEEISIGFIDQALIVELSDGTEFKIPVRRRPALRRVA